MSIQDLGALGELLSSIVVLVTLVYLAIQTSQTRKATLANLHWTRANASRDLSMMWASSPETAMLIQKFGTREEDFPTKTEFDPDLFRYLTMNRSVLELLQAFYMTALSPSDKDLATNRIQQQMRIPGFRASWPTIKVSGTFYPEFIAVVEQCMKSQGQAGT